VRLQDTPDEQISLTDPDARSMATSGRGTGMVGYNVRTAVDTRHHLIVAHEVTNIGNDRGQLASMSEQARDATARIAELDEEIATIAASDPVAKRLQQLRGVDPMVATALLATVGDASRFTNGRQMAASLGLTPKQISSGGKERLLGIRKRGDSYVGCLLVHGARAMIRMAKNNARSDPLSLWVMRIASTRNPNVAAVALASKTARIAWAMIRHETDYQPALATN
jgi:transposase